MYNSAEVMISFARYLSQLPQEDAVQQPFDLNA